MSSQSDSPSAVYPSSVPSKASPFNAQSFICTETIYHSSGSIDIEQTVYNCSVSMLSPNIPNCFNTGIPQVVNTSLRLNNLINIDEIQGTATLDFYWRMIWIDERWRIPDLWTKLPTELSRLKTDGIELINLISNGNNALSIWRPDLFLQDATEMQVQSETIKLRPNGVIYWSRHVIASLAQPHFYYSKYPLDRQSVRLIYYSYSMPDYYLKQYFRSSPITYVKNLGEGNQEHFTMNSVWSHTAGECLYKIVPVDDSQGALQRTFLVAQIDLYVNRKSEGIIIRLAIPTLILMILGGLTFWAAPDTRVDATMTILLSISALYIVVFSSIPMIGYLTTFDKYTVTMFFVLTICAGIHQGVNRMMMKGENYPLRIFYVRVTEFMGRMIIIPFSVIFFGALFNDNTVVKELKIIALLVLIISMCIVGLREFFGVKKAYFVAMTDVRHKMDNPLKYKISALEAFLYSMYMKYGSKQDIRHSFSAKMDDIRIVEMSDIHIFSQNRDIGPRSNVDLGDVKIIKTQNNQMHRTHNSNSNNDSDDETS